MDLAIEEDDVASDEGLRTAILLSLFTDRRANDGDALPGAPDDLRGWWADELLEPEGDRLGSRLWLLERGKLLPDIVPQVERIAAEALSWLREDGVASRVAVTAEIDGPALVLTVSIDRPEREAVAFRFAHVWSAEEAASAV